MFRNFGEYKASKYSTIYYVWLQAWKTKLYSSISS